MMFSRTSNLVLVALLLAALVLMGWTGRWGLAGLYTHQARQVLDKWERMNSAPGQASHASNERNWVLAMDVLAKARQLAAGDADIFMVLGRLHHHRALTQDSWSKLAKFHWQQTIASYQQVLLLRPAWGYARILLAQAQVQAGGSTKEAIANVMRAITLAPWSNHVHIVSIRLGFVLWPLMDKPQREKIYTLAEKAFPRYGNVILIQAVKYRRLKLIQPLLEKNPQWKTTLDRLLRTR